MDGNRLLSGSYDDSAILWDVASGNALHHFRTAGMQSFCLLFVVRLFCSIPLCGVLTHYQRSMILPSCKSGDGQDVNAVAMFPGDDRCAIVGDRGVARVYNLQDLGEESEMCFPPIEAASNTNDLPGIRAVAVSPSGDFLAIGNSTGAYVFNLNKPEDYELMPRGDGDSNKASRADALPRHDSGYAKAVAVSEDGAFLISAGDDARVRVYERGSMPMTKGANKR
jgi:WD40 repeat protein